MATILLYPKVDCPVGCAYCFADPGVPTGAKYDKRAMIEKLGEISGDPHESVILHGGEVLSLPVRDFEFFLKAVYKLRGTTHIQTSLVGLTAEHIRLFKKYKTNIGVSVDGPPELNILRGPRDSDQNQTYQKKLVKNMAWLREKNIGFGTISVLTKANAVGDKLETLIEWASTNGINGRFNPMFLPFWSDSLSQYQLTPQELKTAWIRLAEVALENPKLEWLPAREFIDNLLGCSSLACCIVARCDYLTTMCKTIMPDGNLARCDRCFQDGYYYRSNLPTTARADMLGQTECSDCKYFSICGGGCAGEGEGGDPRHKTMYCEAYYGLYEFLEKRIRGMMPNVTLSVDVPDYYNECCMKGKRINFTERMKEGTWKSSPPDSGHEDYYMDPEQNRCNCGGGEHGR